MDEEVRIREDGTADAVKRKGPSLCFSETKRTVPLFLSETKRTVPPFQMNEEVRTREDGTAEAVKRADRPSVSRMDYESGVLYYTTEDS